MPIDVVHCHLLSHRRYPPDNPGLAESRNFRMIRMTSVLQAANQDRDMYWKSIKSNISWKRWHVGIGMGATASLDLLPKLNIRVVLSYKSLFPMSKEESSSSSIPKEAYDSISACLLWYADSILRRILKDTNLPKLSRKCSVWPEVGILIQPANVVCM